MSYSEPQFNFFNFMAKILLYIIIGLIVAMLIFWAVVFFQSTSIIQTRLSDLNNIVAEENCMPYEGGENSCQAKYEQLLKQSETPWLSFVNNADNYDKGKSYYVGNGTDKEYIGYIDAPQRGTGIVTKVRGYMYLPLVISAGLEHITGNEDETTGYKVLIGQPNGIALVRRPQVDGVDRLLEIRVPITKEYVVMGLRFFKDKE